MACQDYDRLAEELKTAQTSYLESKTNKLSRLSGSRKELRQRDEFAKHQAVKAQNALLSHVENCSACRANKS